MVSIRPQLAPSRSSPNGFQDRVVRGSGCEGYEVDGVLLKEPGEDGADDPGVVFAVSDDAGGLDLMVAAAAAGLQCAHANMVNPRPSQLVQTAPLEIVNTKAITPWVKP